jgi:hypothetical protein
VVRSDLALAQDGGSQCEAHLPAPLGRFERKPGIDCKVLSG